MSPLFHTLTFLCRAGSYLILHMKPLVYSIIKYICSSLRERIKIWWFLSFYYYHFLHKLVKEKWNTSYELRVPSSDIPVTSSNSRVKSSNLPVTSSNCPLQVQSHELGVQIHKSIIAHKKFTACSTKSKTNKNSKQIYFLNIN